MIGMGFVLIFVWVIDVDFDEVVGVGVLLFIWLMVNWVSFCVVVFLVIGLYVVKNVVVL